MLGVILVTAFVVAGATVGLVLLLAFRGYRLANTRAVEAERIAREGCRLAGLAEGILHSLTSDPSVPAPVATQLELALIELRTSTRSVRDSLQRKELH